MTWSRCGDCCPDDMLVLVESEGEDSLVLVTEAIESVEAFASDMMTVGFKETMTAQTVCIMP